MGKEHEALCVQMEQIISRFQESLTLMEKMNKEIAGLNEVMDHLGGSFQKGNKVIQRFSLHGMPALEEHLKRLDAFQEKIGFLDTFPNRIQECAARMDEVLTRLSQSGYVARLDINAAASRQALEQIEAGTAQLMPSFERLQSIVTDRALEQEMASLREEMQQDRKAHREAFAALQKQQLLWQEELKAALEVSDAASRNSKGGRG